MHEQLLPIRQLELDAALRHIPAGSVVLEIGAGNGWQASRLRERGHDVVALDVGPRRPEHGEHFDVQLYDGVHLPLADSSVDVIFSSNVLEHVEDLPGLLADCRRVLRPGGHAVHIVPSHTWRLWTILTRYVLLLQLATRSRRLPQSVQADESSGQSGRVGRGLQFLRRALVEKPHGEFPSAVAEITEYRPARWVRRFQENRWRELEQYGSGVFYTGYGVLPRLRLTTRARLSRVLGSSCTVFVVEPVPEGPATTA